MCLPASRFFPHSSCSQHTRISSGKMMLAIAAFHALMRDVFSEVGQWDHLFETKPFTAASRQVVIDRCLFLGHSPVLSYPSEIDLHSLEFFRQTLPQDWVWRITRTEDPLMPLDGNSRRGTITWRELSGALNRPKAGRHLIMTGPFTQSSAPGAYACLPVFG
jgi:hypothetical protein